MMFFWDNFLLMMSCSVVFSSNFDSLIIIYDKNKKQSLKDFLNDPGFTNNSTRVVYHEIEFNSSFRDVSELRMPQTGTILSFTKWFGVIEELVTGRRNVTHVPFSDTVVALV